MDPLNSFHQLVFAYQLGQLRRYDEALAQARKALAMPQLFDPTFGHEVLWRAFHQKGQHGEALVQAESVFAADQEIRDALSRGHSAGGYGEAYNRAADELSARPTMSSWEIENAAILYSFAGNKSRALDMLEKGYETRHSMMSFIGIDPHWDALRMEPRFRDLVRRLKLPQGPPA